MKKRLALLLSGLLAGIGVFSISAGAASETAELEFNICTIIVDKQVVNSTVIVYNKDFYLTDEALSYYLQTPVNYYKTTMTYYIGDVDKIKTTELPAVTLTGWRRKGAVKKEPVESTVKPGLREVSATINPVKVKVDGRANSAKSLRYDKTYYLQVSPVVKALGKSIHYYSSTSTLYIGEPPDGEVPSSVLQQWKEQDAENAKQGTSSTNKSDRTTGSAVQKNRIISTKDNSKTSIVASSSSSAAETREPENNTGASQSQESSDTPSSATAAASSQQTSASEPAVSSSSSASSSSTASPISKDGLYDVAATGDYAGWRRLMGHSYAASYAIYFRTYGDVGSGYYEIATVPLKQENLHESIKITLNDGTTETLTRSQWYSLFRNGCSISGGAELLRNKYGQFFSDWYALYFNPAPADLAQKYILDVYG